MRLYKDTDIDLNQEKVTVYITYYKNDIMKSTTSK